MLNLADFQSDHLKLKLGIFSGHIASFKIGVLEILNFHPCIYTLCMQAAKAQASLRICNKHQISCKLLAQMLCCVETT